MIVKVCGITNADDAAAAIGAGANAIGFNFYPRSPRYIAPEAAAQISTAGARRVGVFVNEDPARIAEIARIAALDTAQLHGEETPADYPGGVAIWKAARVTATFDFAPYTQTTAEALLLDGPAGELYGGAGRSFDWSLARAATIRIVLAGGLDAANVAQAIAIAHPWGVDACSRIESAPGKKDHPKMLAYIQAALHAAPEALAR
jgi:phosphoribosylanthranilate isomerase